MHIGMFDMQPDTFDVGIVGSGASGGTLASHLARRGVRVAIVEGGPRVNTGTDFNTHAMPFDFPTRQIPTMLVRGVFPASVASAGGATRRSTA